MITRATVERNEIEAFLTLCEELHFGRTAERLRVSTAHVSKTIKAVERQVGVALFDRTSRKVALTPVGAQLRDELRPAYEQMQRSVRNARLAGRGIAGTLRVGYFGSAGGRYLLEVGEKFHARYPECEVRITEMQLSDGANRLRSGEVEALLCCFPMCEPDMAIGPPLISEDKMLAVASGHDFARRQTVSLEDLADVEMIQNPPELPADFDEFHHPKRTPSGRRIPPGPTATTFQEILALVGAGKGVYLTTTQAPLFYTRPDVTFVPVTDAPPLQFGLGWMSTGLTRRVEALVQVAVDVGNQFRS
ncbi:LysR family transcriptional regulator [Nocardia sp. NPDC057440]|uniref:LysR family transcriptional regulator n=1 Tax=Nocardia sp. NPDC057440 TaxID=3346134 RepID=UPI0036702532